MSTDRHFQRVLASADLACADIQFGSESQYATFRYTSPNAQRNNLTRRRYLVASITKPIVGMAVLKLAAEGHLSLAERIGRILPAFSKAAYRRITPRHLLTHTSGFPDMLPNNAELRAAHASLGDFLTGAAHTDLEFSTATDCHYSSVGFLILAALLEEVTGTSLSEYLATQFFHPLGMLDTRLGLNEDEADSYLPDVVPSILPAWQSDAADWGWNSRYWRSLGAPWGGLLSTASDLRRYATMLLSDGTATNGSQILPEAVIRTATANQVRDYAIQNHRSGSQRGWGFGWRQQWPSHSASFGDFVSAQTFGHWGATGTLMWVDPVHRQFAIILTTTPYEDSRTVIQRLSNIIVSR